MIAHFPWNRTARHLCWSALAGIVTHWLLGQVCALLWKRVVSAGSDATSICGGIFALCVSLLQWSADKLRNDMFHGLINAWGDYHHDVRLWC